MVGVFNQLCVELIESGNEAYILEILPLFRGLDFKHGRQLEALTCDLLSRGAHRVGADLIVHGGDLFKFKDGRQQGSVVILSHYYLELLSFIFNFDVLSRDR